MKSEKIPCEKNIVVQTIMIPENRVLLALSELRYYVRLSLRCRSQRLRHVRPGSVLQCIRCVLTAVREPDADDEQLTLTLRGDIVHCVRCWALLQHIRSPAA